MRDVNWLGKTAETLTQWRSCKYRLTFFARLAGETIDCCEMQWGVNLECICCMTQVHVCDSRMSWHIDLIDILDCLFDCDPIDCMNMAWEEFESGTMTVSSLLLWLMLKASNKDAVRLA